mmetsp:Transcript_31552/g.49295  ORF Transcript_31552/g.49295 Transcript_31552/m.49295 type:complete len:295 (+) Transcript_31552:217-1101(+)
MMRRLHDANLGNQKLQTFSVQGHLLYGHLLSVSLSSSNKHFASSSLTNLLHIGVEGCGVFMADQLVQSQRLISRKRLGGRIDLVVCSSLGLSNGYVRGFVLLVGSSVGELKNLKNSIGILDDFLSCDIGVFQHLLPFRGKASESSFRVEINMDVVLNVEGGANNFDLGRGLDFLHPLLHVTLCGSLDKEAFVDSCGVQLKYKVLLSFELVTPLDNSVLQGDVSNRLGVQSRLEIKQHITLQDEPPHFPTLTKVALFFQFSLFVWATPHFWVQRFISHLLTVRTKKKRGVLERGG